MFIRTVPILYIKPPELHVILVDRIRAYLEYTNG